MRIEVSDVTYPTDKPTAPPYDFILSVYKPLVFRICSALKYCNACSFIADFKCVITENGSSLFKGKIKGKDDGFSASPCIFQLDVAPDAPTETKTFSAMRILNDLKTKIVDLRFTIIFALLCQDDKRDSFAECLRYAAKCALDDFVCNTGYPVLSQDDLF